MTRRLVFIHGRAQEHKDAGKLKQEWLDALAKGLDKNHLPAIADADARIAFYGDTLFDLVAGRPTAEAAEVIVRGVVSDQDEARFLKAVLDEVLDEKGITDDMVDSVTPPTVIDRGFTNWEWVQSILGAIDRYVPGASGASIAIATHDVYRYLTDGAIRGQIEDGVAGALATDRENVVVSHSLGTVVAYHLLSREGVARGWKVALFVTLGSPLGVTAIRKAMKQLTNVQRCPSCAAAWFNAMDERDVVALRPLTTKWFQLDPTAPAIENKTDVDNWTDNRHGIVGYLDDSTVAQRIHQALS